MRADASGASSGCKGSGAAGQKLLSDFGDPDPTGIRDTSQIFRSAIESVAPGASISIVVSNATGHDRLRLGSVVDSEGRNVSVDLTSGAGVGANFGGVGPGVLYVDRVVRYASGLFDEQLQGTGDTAFSVPLFSRQIVVNNGGHAAIGNDFVYNNENSRSSNRNGGDIAYQSVAAWPNLRDGTGLLGRWYVTVTPLTGSSDLRAGANWGSEGLEINPVNNGPEPRFTEFDSSMVGDGRGVPSTYSAGVLVQPDRWDPTGGYGGSGQFGFGCFPYPGRNKRQVSSNSVHIPNSEKGPYDPGWASCFHVGNNAVIRDGHAIYLGGNTSAPSDALPGSAILVRHKWESLVDTTDAVFESGVAVKLGQGQGIQFRAVTIGSLPVCSVKLQDVVMVVSDASKLVYAAPPIGGGSIHTPVFCDGRVWRMH